MKYYIQNKERGYLGNAPMFWKIGDNGYSVDLNVCKQFTYDEAKIICLNNPSKNRAWPVEYINENDGIQRIVDSQYLDDFMIENFKDK